MSIDPKVSAWINLVMAIVGFLATAGALLTPVFGESVAHNVVAGCGLVLGIWSAINTGLHGVSSEEKGPLAPK